MVEPDSRLRQLRGGPALFLDMATLVGVMGESAFYAALPAQAAGLHVLGRDLHGQVVRGAMKDEQCSGCSTMTKVLRPFVSRLGAALRSAGPDGCLPLRRYLSLKRGYRPRQILLNYKDELGGLHRVTF